MNPTPEPGPAMRFLALRFVVSLACSLFAFLPGLAIAQTVDTDFFENRVRPVLSAHCLHCHGSKKQEAGLRLDSRESILQGGDSGPSVDLENLSESYLLTVLKHLEDDVQMPPDGKLKDTDIAAIEKWVLSGAPWPKAVDGTVIPADLTSDEGIAYAQKTHWAFQPVRKPPIPKSTQPDSESSPVDRFITRKLTAAGLEMAPPAEPRKLMRRLYFDLIGLPPKFEEVQRFDQDPTPDKVDRLVDELLARPEYGERWGRHWLDIARYADTRGYLVAGRDTKYHHGFTYRDYVIRSFNLDKPYDQFVLEQLAADKLQPADPNDQAAMGFLTTGRRFINNIHEITDDRIDVVTRGLLGMTLQCARCHDHKFDPLTAKDYYALYGVFRSSTEPAENELPVIGDAEVARVWQDYYEREIVPLEKELRETINAKNKAKGDAKIPLKKQENAINAKLKEARKREPQKPARAMVMVDGGMFNPYVFERGKANQRGEKVDRRFLQVVNFASDNQPFKDGSGRLELAEAIADAKNPLTARVIVNRIWQHHFGAGLVATPSDFGYRGEKPSHPELLDYLAATLIENGWSIKKIHRIILTSSVYQQSTTSALTKAVQSADPENRLLARMNLRRLQWEPLRDSILFTSGSLNRQMTGPSLDIFKRPFATRRSVYAYVDRQIVHETFRNFDFANPDATTAIRAKTTVPQQSLYMMNSPFVIEQVRSLAADIAQKHSDWTQRVRQLFRQLLQRNPTDAELEIAVDFLQNSSTFNGDKASGDVLSPWQVLVQSLMQSNEFIFVE